MNDRSEIASCALNEVLSAVPAVTEFATACLLTPQPGTRPLSLTREGHLVVNVDGEMMTRTDQVLVCSENLAIRPLNLRMQGREVPQVFRRLASLEGRGYLILSRGNEVFYPLRLDRDLCFFLERYVWALESSLMWDVGRIPGPPKDQSSDENGSETFSDANPSDEKRDLLADEDALIRIAGEGSVAIRIPGQIDAIKVSEGCSHRVAVDAFVGWVGNIVPYRVPGAPFIRCEGEGALFVNLPSEPSAPSKYETQSRPRSHAPDRESESD